MTDSPGHHTVGDISEYPTVWDMDRILKEDCWEPLFNDLKARVVQYDSYWEKMQADMSLDSLREFLELDDLFNTDLQRLTAAPYARWGAETNREEFGSQYDQAIAFGKENSDRLSKIWEWMKGKEIGGKKLDHQNASRLFAADQRLKEYLHREWKKAAVVRDQPENDALRFQQLESEIDNVTSERVKLQNGLRYNSATDAVKIEKGGILAQAGSIDEIAVLHNF